MKQYKFVTEIDEKAFNEMSYLAELNTKDSDTNDFSGDARYAADLISAVLHNDIIAGKGLSKTSVFTLESRERAVEFALKMKKSTAYTHVSWIYELDENGHTTATLPSFRFENATDPSEVQWGEANGVSNKG